QKVFHAQTLSSDSEVRQQPFLCLIPLFICCSENLRGGGEQRRDSEEVIFSGTAVKVVVWAGVLRDARIHSGLLVRCVWESRNLVFFIPVSNPKVGMCMHGLTHV
uniref:Uncharacterized protein n=1 Tax=Poecilia mexicana TaxID=48701 RepID=A0A3B3XWG0_9TELE